jgi:ABC-2 type transport system ATP-binding protein
MPGPAVEVVDLVKRYGDTTAVDKLSLSVPRGKITAVLGPNGAGKTTTLECCEGYRRPDAGVVRVLGLDPVRDGRRLRSRVGVLLQSGGVYPSVRVAEALRHAAALYAHPMDPALLLDRLGLDRARRTPYRQLSGGQQRRLCLALALIGRPELVFLDEPSSGLDPQGRRTTWGVLEDLRRDGVTVVLTTHLMDEAERLADMVAVIDSGRVLAWGPPVELTAETGRDSLRFTGPPRLDLALLRAALPEGSRAWEVTPGRYRVEGALEPQLFATVASWCAGNGLFPGDLAVARRSLEDVFLELTGRELRS